MRRSFGLPRRAGPAAFVFVAFVVAVCATAPRVFAHDPDALWKIVHGRCALDPVGHKPCAVYDAGQGDAVLHSIEGQGQYLLIPTARVSGIESAALLDPSTPDYFAQAWAARGRVGRDYHRSIPDTDLALAINSRYGRSQNQLHIHIDCIRPDARAALLAALPSIGPRWSALDRPILGIGYRAIWRPDLSISPFRVLAASLPDPAHDMAAHTLVVWPATRADGRSGFVILDDAAHGLDRASGEILQDHACTILTAG